MHAWIIGNGPSLAQTPLELLKDEVCFATGRIHLIYLKTTWRPTHYVMTEGADTTQAMKDDFAEQIKLGIPLYLSRGWKGNYTNWNLRKYEQKTTRIDWIKTCPEHTGVHAGKDAPKVWHLPDLCGFGSSLHVAMQIAVLEGYTPLYLLGCDMGYVDGQPNHFDPNYEAGLKLRPANQTNSDIKWAHNVCFRSCPTPVYNCSVGGELEVYPRAFLEDVLRNNYDSVP